MNDNDYDRAERAAIKRLDPAGFLAWLFFYLLDPDLAFWRWMETQRAPFPGEPDRRCDCVAEFVSRGGSQGPWLALVEPQGQWQTNFLSRAFQYAFMLHDEARHGPHGEDRYPIMVGIVDVCERPLPETVSWVPAGAPAGKGLTAGVFIRHVYTEPATATLAGIAAGRIARCILVWIPLMAGGDDPAVAERWKELAAAEPDRVMRANCGLLAITLAEKRNRRAMWEKALEGWNVVESSYLREWRDKARQEERENVVRETLLDVLKAKYAKQLPSDVLANVERQTNPVELRRWLLLAVDKETLDEFRAAIAAGGSPANGATGS